MTDHHWKLYVNMLEIQKPVLLQFQLLAGVVINTSLKMVRKGIENVAEIRSYIKTCCKLDECQKHTWSDMCRLWEKTSHFPQFIGEEVPKISEKGV